MSCNATSDAPLLQRGCRVALLVVALGAASVALGLGLPYMLADSPPTAETLWARKAQGAIAPPVAPADAPVETAAPVSARRPG